MKRTPSQNQPMTRGVKRVLIFISMVMVVAVALFAPRLVRAAQNFDRTQKRLVADFEKTTSLYVVGSHAITVSHPVAEHQAYLYEVYLFDSVRVARPGRFQAAISGYSQLEPGDTVRAFPLAFRDSVGRSLLLIQQRPQPQRHTGMY